LPSSLGSYLRIKLAGRAPNAEGIGATITVEAGGRTQVRALRAGSNYVSQDPAEAHFGLGDAAWVDSVNVRWPSGRSTKLHDVAVNQRIVIDAPAPRSERSWGCSFGR